MISTLVGSYIARVLIPNAAAVVPAHWPTDAGVAARLVLAPD
ncbi:hypothetical protein [Streptomyces sp. GMR22]|nr:hypothetical protein [Streptomyces sp. GMR22]